MRASSVLGGNYIKADTVKSEGPQRLTIVEVGTAEFEKENGKKERRLELTFTDERKLTLNSGNTEVLIAAFGDETDEWAGKSIVAYHDPSVKFAGKKVGGVKVKVQSAAPKAAAAVVEKADDPFSFSDQF